MHSVVGENYLQQGGLPGLTRLDHVGFTVPDLDEAEAFLVDVLGCQFLYRLGPFRSEDDWMRTHMNNNPGTVMEELRFYSCGGQAVFEVFKYADDQQRTKQPRNYDIGGHHIAFYVNDIDAAIDYLRDRGVTVLAGPTASSGPSEGQRWVYFLSPWGMQFELCSYPSGKAFWKQ